MFINIINNNVSLHNLIILKTNIMEHFKRAKVIMLSTNNKSHIYSNKSIKTLGYVTGKVESDLEQFFNQTETQNQHLYIVSDDEIKNGDWCIYLNFNPKIDKNQIWQVKGSLNNKHLFRKIIATTDTSLNEKNSFNGKNWNHLLPQPSQQFIEKYIESYNKSKIINDVLVEYESKNINIHRFEDELKIDSKNNTIVIKKAKDSWNKEEIIDIINKYTIEMASEIKNYHRDKWIEKNI